MLLLEFRNVLQVLLLSYQFCSLAMQRYHNMTSLLTLSYFFQDGIKPLTSLSSRCILNMKRLVTLKYKQRKTSKASSENSLEVRRQPH